jgi:uncharacterized membrane protein
MVDAPVNEVEKKNKTLNIIMYNEGKMNDLQKICHGK